MCGIGGILQHDLKLFDRNDLTRLTSALAPRGPDDQNTYDQGPCALVHTRLAVIDPNTGQQPMTTQDNAAPLTVVCNGEIYNHHQLRKQLTNLGHTFHTHHSDTEVLLYAYRQWGHNLTNHLRGMFAFAIWDAHKCQLLLARDPVGKKPLYYTHDQSQNRFIFASLPAALQPFTPNTTNQSALLTYLHTGYTQDTTLNQDILQLPPGGRLTLSPGGNITQLPINNIITHAIDASEESPPTTSPNDNLTQEIHQLLINAVQSRLEADVPLGCFLSGGLDSSIIAAIAQKHLQKQGQTLQTFTAAMPHAQYDESPFAQQVATHLGTKHHQLQINTDFENDLIALIKHIGQPFGDSSILPTYYLSKEIKNHVTVALSGDGGDELFFGYQRYQAMNLIQKHRALIKLFPTFILPKSNPKSPFTKLKRLVLAAKQSSPLNTYLSITNIFTPTQLQQLLPDINHESAGFNSYLTNLAKQWEQHQSLPNLPQHTSPADTARLTDLTQYLPNDLLQKVDRASMMTALEVRCPMLDTQLVSKLLPLNYNTLCPNKTLKQTLKQIASQYLPPQIINRKKMGFALPIGQWFRTTQQPVLQRWLIDEPHLQNLGINQNYTRQLIRQHQANTNDHTQRLFTLLTLAMHQSNLNS